MYIYTYLYIYIYIYISSIYSGHSIYSTYSIHSLCNMCSRDGAHSLYIKCMLCGVFESLGV